VKELGIEIGVPWTIDPARQKQSRKHEKIRHAEGARPFDKAMEPALEAERVFDTEGRMHEDDKDDADALAVIDPVDSRGCFSHAPSFRHHRSGMQPNCHAT
jgi:hypothetical protein